MTRRDTINRLLDNTANRGPAATALVNALKVSLAEDEADAAKEGREPLDPRKVIIGTMKSVRAAMAEIRDELDGMDGLGKYK